MVLGLAACGGRGEVFVTSFDAEHHVSLRHPATWTRRPAEPGTDARFHLFAPKTGAKGQAVSITFVAAPPGESLDAYASRYLEGKQASGTPRRTGETDRTDEFTSSDGATRYAVRLLKDADRIVGLYAQGPAELFRDQEASVRDVLASLALERAEAYVEQKHEAFGFSIRLPPSWKTSRTLSGGGSFMAQYASPALGLDREAALHASLTVTVEPLADGVTLARYYDETRQKLGDAFKVLDHRTVEDGYVDVMISETPMAVSRIKRFYRTAGGRGYSLTFEARDDVYDGAAGWFDLVAGTFRLGPATR